MTKFALKNGSPLTDLRFGKRGELAIASNGELNANSNKELLHRIGQLMTAASNGEIAQEQKATAAELAQARREEFAAALTDPAKWADLGIAIAAELDEAAARDGFLRALVVEESLQTGQRPQIRVRYPNVVAVTATSVAEVSPQFVRDKYLYPVEFHIVANLEIDNTEINQATGDILDEKYREGLQAVMVEEDRMWKRGADATVGLANPLTTISSALTPAILSAVTESVRDWNLPVTSAVLATDFWTDIATNSAWQVVFDPVAQAEILLTGRLGQIYGVQLRTDGFRPAEQKVLERGELYVVAQPEYHGAITTRGGLTPTSLDGALHGRTTRGWYMQEPISFAISNARSVAKAKR